VDQANASMMALSGEQYLQWTKLEDEIREKLKQAVAEGADPSGELGKKLADLHRQWLSVSLKGQYDPMKHRGIAQLYIMDERFTEYYDSQVKGCAKFLCDAVQNWIK